MGGGGEEHLPRTDVIEGAGDGARVDAADDKAAFSAMRHALYAALPRGSRGASESGKTEAQGVSASPRVPGASFLSYASGFEHVIWRSFKALFQISTVP